MTQYYVWQCQFPDVVGSTLILEPTHTIESHMVTHTKDV